MPTLNEYFRTEARDFLNALERSLQRAPGPDAGELHRAVRGLRGTAQMAREQRIFDVVSAFESVTRAIAGGALTWSDNIAARARETIADLRVLLDPTEDDEQLDARVSDAASRWREADPDPVLPAATPVVDHGTREFREFAAREAAGIAAALDRGVSDLQADPMDREPLTSILRRQRALLGSARLDEIPVVADILRAVEDLTRVIVKLDVGVKKEWLDIYRVARDALQATIAALLRDELPEPSHAVSRLRHMREELLERYGSTVEPPPPPEDSLAPPTLSHPTAPFVAPRAATPAVASDVRSPGAAAAQSAVPAVTEDGAADDASGTMQARDAGVAAEEAGVLDLDADSVAEDADMIELDADSMVPEEGMLDLDADSVVAEDGMLDLDADSMVPEDGMLDLDADSVVAEDAGMLELDAESEAEEDAGVLELDADSEVEEDAGMLELDAESEVEEDAGVLELDADSVGDSSAGVLELAADGVVDVAGTGRLDSYEGSVAEESAATMQREVPVHSREEALQRALELRDIITRVAAHDPRARAAVEELFDLIRIALG
jgi:chemotaxis protein histidine kinase CheA